MIRAMICDDEAAAQQIISYYIASEGMPIEIVGTAADGSQALERIWTEKPDLVFMDIQMPGLNGFEVMEALRQENIQVIVITAYSTFDYAQRALRLGAVDILSKPIDLEQLRHAIVRATGWNFTTNDTLNRAILYVHQHYQEKITLEALAGEACCTTSHLVHLFQQHFQMSTTAYVNKLRVNKAVRLLRRGTSIQETAFQVGYTSLNHFYKNFKLYMGQTPAAFQKNEGGAGEP